MVRCPQAGSKKKWNTGEKKETTVPVYKMEMFSPKKKLLNNRILNGINLTH